MCVYVCASNGRNDTFCLTTKPKPEPHASANTHTQHANHKLECRMKLLLVQKFGNLYSYIEKKIEDKLLVGSEEDMFGGYLFDFVDCVESLPGRLLDKLRFVDLLKVQLGIPTD
jgi:hypothetical protein